MPALVTVEIPQLRDMRGRFASMSEKELRQMRKEGMQEAGNLLVAKLRFEAPVGRGPTGGSLQKSFYTRVFESANKMTLRAYSRMPYAMTVALGTKKKNYPILPIVGKVLAMKKYEIVGPFAARQTKVVFRPWVKKHPGQEANPYHVRAVEGLRPEWDRIWNRMGVRIVQRLAGT